MNLNRILLYVNVFFLESYLIRFQVGSYSTNLQEVLITLQAVFFCVELLRTKSFGKVLMGLKKHWVLLSFVALTGLSLLVVPMVPIMDKVYFFRHLKFLIFGLVLCFIFIETFKSSEQREKALRIMGFGALTFGVFCAAANLLGFWVTYDYRLLGPLDAAVYLAYYLTPFFLFFAIQFLENTKKRMDLLCAILLGVLIIATRSMASITVSFIILCMYFFVKSERKFLKSKQSKIILVAIALIIAVVVFATKIKPFLYEQSSSLGEREQIWVTSIDLLKNPKNLIMGVGLGQFQYYFENNVVRVLGFPPLDFNVLQPHDIFLLFVFQYGILGLIFILFCIYKAFQALKTKNNFQLQMVLILFYFLMHGLIDTPFFKNDLLILLVLFMELALVNQEKISSHQSV